MYGKKSKKTIRFIWIIVGLLTALSMVALPLVYLF